MQVNYKYTFVFCCLTLFGILIYFPSIDAPFAIEDEYEFLDIANGKIDYKTRVIHHVSFIDFHKRFIKLGRYAPFSVGVKYLKAKIFPNNSKANHIILIGIAVLTAFLFFLIFREFEVGIFLSIIGALLYLFAPFATINIRLSTGESLGNLCLFLAILLLIKFIKTGDFKLLVMAILAVLFMSQSKESYTLLVPALAVCFVGFKSFYLNIDWITTIKKSIFHIFIIFVIPFLIGVIGVIYVIYVRGDVFAYGGTNSYLTQFLSNFVWLIKWLIPILIFNILSGYSLIKKNNLKPLWISLCVIICWLGSQLVSYYNIKISYSQIRYLAPGTLVLLFFSILSIHILKRQSYFIYNLGISIALLLIIKFAKLAYIDAGVFKASTKAYHKIMDHISNNKIESIAFYQGYEIVNSSLSELNHRGFIPQIYASTTKLVKDDNKDFNNYLLEILRNSYKVLEFDSIIKNNSVPQMLIVSFPLPDNKELPDQYIRESFRTKIVFSEKYANLKFSDLINADFYRGSLNNDSISYVAYLR